VVSWLNPANGLAGERDYRSDHKDQGFSPDPSTLTLYFILRPVCGPVGPGRLNQQSQASGPDFSRAGISY